MTKPTNYINLLQSLSQESYTIPACFVFAPPRSSDHPPTDPRCDPRGTYQITTGRASRKMPIVDFGVLPLQKAKVTHVVLYNRTGIATPFSAFGSESNWFPLISTFVLLLFRRFVLMLVLCWFGAWFKLMSRLPVP